MQGVYKWASSFLLMKKSKRTSFTSVVIENPDLSLTGISREAVVNFSRLKLAVSQANLEKVDSHEGPLASNSHSTLKL